MRTRIMQIGIVVEIKEGTQYRCSPTAEPTPPTSLSIVVGTALLLPARVVGAFNTDAAIFSSRFTARRAGLNFRLRRQCYAAPTVFAFFHHVVVAFALVQHLNLLVLSSLKVGLVFTRPKNAET